MKEYDKQKIKYEKAVAFHQELDRHFRRKDAWECRGKKAHLFQLAIPSYVKWEKSPQEYYDEMARHRVILDAHQCGFERCPFRGWGSNGTRYYQCTRCGKQAYEHDGKPDYRIQNALYIAPTS